MGDRRRIREDPSWCVSLEHQVKDRKVGSARTERHQVNADGESKILERSRIATIAFDNPRKVTWSREGHPRGGTRMVPNHIKSREERAARVKLKKKVGADVGNVVKVFCTRKRGVSHVARGTGLGRSKGFLGAILGAPLTRVSGHRLAKWMQQDWEPRTGVI